MIRFKLLRIVPSADWESVTLDMAPDEIEYAVTTEDNRITQQDSLTALVALYVHCNHEADTSQQQYAAFDIEVENDRITLASRPFTEAVRFEGSRSDLREALEPFLSDIFAGLDANSTAEQRRRALLFLSTELEYDCVQLYRRLV